MTAAPSSSTTRRIRVLVVDDSVVVRRLVSQALESDPAIEVVGTAANGNIAIQRIPQMNPDLVTLDIEMPDCDGLETLRRVRKTWPRLPVVMFSTLTRRGAVETLEALSIGASDYVTKPSNVGSIDEGLEAVRSSLIPKVKALCRFEPPPAMLPARPEWRALAATRGERSGFDIVAIGVSTGGPNALAAVIPALPRTFPVPVLIVQHMPPLFTKMLAERLDASSPLAVQEAEEGQPIQPGHVYIAPGDYHLTLVRKGAAWNCALNREPPENSCRPAVDVLFRSIAESFGSRSLALVLTGMGQDGLRGAERIRESGGRVLAQDEPTSIVWGMPGAVARSGLAEAVLPLGDIATELIRRTRGEQ